MFAHRISFRRARNWCAADYNTDMPSDRNSPSRNSPSRNSPSVPEFQAARTSTTFIVPAPVADFTGREAELAQLEQALVSEERAAVVTTAGMAGVGKSQLAYEACRRIAKYFPDGQIFLDMQGTSRPGAVRIPLMPAQAMARIIGMFELSAQSLHQKDPASLRAEYLSVLSGKRVLLILDDAKDEAQISPLLPQAPAAILVSSRNRFVLEGAKRVNLDSLPLPASIAFLRKVLGTERLASDAELQALAEQCGQNPLALRAAATFLVTHPAWLIAEYLAALKAERLKNLGEVEAVLTLSIESLEIEQPELAELWRLLATFPSSFLPDAAAAVWQVEILKAKNGLDELHRRSLVQCESTTSRFRLHDLLRELAAKGLEQGTQEVIAARHAVHYAQVPRKAQEIYSRGREAVLNGLALFDAERINVEKGYAWASLHLGTHAKLICEYTNTGVNILDMRLLPQERLSWFETAVRACRSLGNQHGECVALGEIAVAWRQAGEPKRALEFHEQARSIAVALGNSREEARQLCGLGNAYDELDDLNEAVKYHQRALDTARNIGDRYLEGDALGGLGKALRKLGEPLKAIECHEADLAFRRETGLRRGESNALWLLGLALEAAGKRGEAIERIKGSLEIRRELKDRTAQRNEEWLSQHGVGPDERISRGAMSGPNLKPTRKSKMSADDWSLVLNAYRCDKLALFVGSGLSLGADVKGGFPTWGQIAQRLLELCGPSHFGALPKKTIQAKAELYRHDMRLEQMLSELDTLRTGLSRKYEAALKKIFLPEEADAGAAHRAAIRLGVKAILTTNYDQLLESVKEAPRRQVYTWKESDGALGDLRENRKILLKIHGTVDRYDTVVLTASEYGKAHADKSYQAVLGYLFQSYSFLFIGYGMNDPLDLDLALKSTVDAFGTAANEHFVLLQKPTNDVRDRLWREYNVRAIGYDDHAEVTNILRRIKASRKTAASSSAGTPER